VFGGDGNDEQSRGCPLQEEQLTPPSGMESSRSSASAQSSDSGSAAGSNQRNQALHVVTKMGEMMQVTENVKMKMKDKYRQIEEVTPSNKVFPYNSSSQFHPQSQSQPSSFAKRKATAPPPSQHQQASLT